MGNRFAIATLVVIGLTASAGVCVAESFAAWVDTALELEASTLEPSPGDTVIVTLTIRNDGDFAVTEASVAVPVPTGLTFISAASENGSYDASTGQWTSDASVLSYESTTLTLNLEVDAEGLASIPITAELMSYVGAYGGSDIDSIPGNAEPCEDDYAAIVLEVNGRQVSSPDGGVCPVLTIPDAGALAGVDGGILDAGPEAGLDAGAGGPGSGGDTGCSLANSQAGVCQLLLLSLALVLLRRRRRYSAAISSN